MRTKNKNIPRNHRIPRRRQCEEIPDPGPLTIGEIAGYGSGIFLVGFFFPYAMWTNLGIFFQSRAGIFVIVLLVITSIVAYRDVISSKNVKYYSYFKILTSLAENYYVMGFLIFITTVIDGLLSNKGWLALLISIPGAALITIGLGLPVCVVLAAAIKIQMKEGKE